MGILALLLCPILSLSLHASMPKSHSVLHRLHYKHPSLLLLHHPPPSLPLSLSVPVRADACHGSSDVSCLLSCRLPLVAVQQHILQGLCNSPACCMTASGCFQVWGNLGFGVGVGVVAEGGAEACTASPELHT